MLIQCGLIVERYSSFSNVAPALSIFVIAIQYFFSSQLSLPLSHIHTHTHSSLSLSPSLSFCGLFLQTFSLSFGKPTYILSLSMFVCVLHNCSLSLFLSISFANTSYISTFSILKVSFVISSKLFQVIILSDTFLDQTIKQQLSYKNR